MSKKTPIKKRAPQKKKKSFFVSVFLGTLTSLSIGIILLIVFSLVALSTEEPERLAPICSLIALFITALSGGYIAARAHRENGLFCGALSGIFLIGILVLLVFICSLSIKLSLFMICAPSAVIASAVAGVCAVSTGGEKTNKHRNRF